MKKTLFLSVLITFIFSQEIFASDCPPPKPFLTVASNSELTVLAKVRRYSTYEDDGLSGNTWVTSMEVEIDEVIQGKEEQKKIIISRAVCHQSLSEFEINKIYILAISGKNGDYSLPKCGGSWLAVEQGVATGNVEEGKTSVSLEELKSKIQKKQSANSLFDFSKIFSFSILMLY